MKWVNFQSSRLDRHTSVIASTTITGPSVICVNAMQPSKPYKSVGSDKEGNKVKYWDWGLTLPHQPFPRWHTEQPYILSITFNCAVNHPNLLACRSWVIQRNTPSGYPDPLAGRIKRWSTPLPCGMDLTWGLGEKGGAEILVLSSVPDLGLNHAGSHIWPAPSGPAYLLLCGAEDGRPSEPTAAKTHRSDRAETWRQGPGNGGRAAAGFLYISTWYVFGLTAWTI